MEEKVVKMAQYKARRLGTDNKSSQAPSQKSLPDAGQLWKLLDNNISLSVWLNGNK